MLSLGGNNGNSLGLTHFRIITPATDGEVTIITVPRDDTLMEGSTKLPQLQTRKTSQSRIPKQRLD
jgi:predicted transcriptional regulator